MIAAFAFWAAIVTGFMLKGPIVLGFTALPAVVTWGVLRFGLKNQSAATDLRRVAFWWPAVLAGVLLIVAWPAAALHEYPAALAQWKREIVDRTAGNIGHGDEGRRDPLIAYLWLWPQSALPWFPFALPAAWALGRTRRDRRSPLRRPGHVLLVCWSSCGVAMVSVIAFKVLHYVLPIVVPLLILSAFGFDRLLTWFLARRPKASRRGWEIATLAGWFGAATVGWLVWSGVVVPSKDYGREVVSFAAKIDAIVPADATIDLFNIGEERTSWYLHRPLRQTTTAPTRRPAYVLTSQADLPALRAAAASPITVLIEANPFIVRPGPGEGRVLVRVD